VGGTSEYDIPSDCVGNRIQNVDVEYNNALYHLEPISISRAHEAYYQFEDITSSYYAVKGNKIVLYPTPSENLTAALKITYTKRVTELGVPQGSVTSTGTAAVMSSTAVSTVDQGNKKFTFSGADLSSLVVDDSLTISGSTGNDGTYTVTAFDDTADTITVSEAIPDATADGNGSIAAVQTIVVDDLGDSLAADVYISVCDPVDHDLAGSHQIRSTNATTNTITLKPSPDLTTYRGTTISGTMSGVVAEDIVILAPKTAVSEILRDHHDYLVDFATREVLKKAKEPIEEITVSLKERENELENAKADRVSFETVNITKEQLDYGD
jgi:hypothetical protein